MSRLVVYLLSSRSSTTVLCVLAVLAVARLALVEVLDHRVQAKIAQLKQEGIRVELTQFSAPQTGDSSDNAAPFYQSAWTLCEGVKIVPLWAGYQKTLSQNCDAIQSKRADVERLVQDRAEVFKLLAQGYAKPDCRYHYRGQGFRMQIPNFIAMRSMCYLDSYRNILDIQQSRYSAVVEDTAHLLRFVRRFQYGDSLIQQMVTLTLNLQAVVPLQRMAELGVHADYRAVTDELKLLQAQWRTAPHRSVEAEQANALDCFKNLESPSFVAEVFGDDQWYKNSEFGFRLYFLGGRPLQLVDELAYLDLARKIDRTARDGSPFPDFTQVPRWCMFTGMLMPNYIRAFEQMSKITKDLDSLEKNLEALQTLGR